LFYNKVLGQRYQHQREPWVAKSFADQVSSRLSASANCILSPGSVPIARLQSKIPKVFYTDATFAGMLGFYEDFTNLCTETVRHGHRLEQEALSSCAMAVYSSDWAAQTAIEHYHVDPSKVKVVPFGANIECNRSVADIKRIISKRPKDTCKLLFIGVDWIRKGGPLTLEIAERLNKAGLKTELHIAGLRNLPVTDLPEFVKDHGFISKSTPEGRAKLEGLIADSHFLLLPANAEAYGLVLCEANSFGVADIASNVGGIPTIVKDDVNGRTFPLGTSADEYALYIADLFSNYEEYERMALSSFNEFQQRLNWKVAGKKLMGLLREL
ncbi:MAG TPA: glycosyltransferase family 4 protein, partial [Puia sp.]|nr:glycosyltransferase family 4 protein [Puia sp.]